MGRSPQGRFAGAADLRGFGSRVPQCYKATVNESETINDAKPWWRGDPDAPLQRSLQRNVRVKATPEVYIAGVALVPGGWRSRQALRFFEVLRPRPSSNGAALGSVRKCRIALRARPGDFARPQFPDSRPFLPVPHRALRRRQDVAPEAVVPVAAADP